MSVHRLLWLLAACVSPGCAQHPAIRTNVAVPAANSLESGEKTYALLPAEHEAGKSAMPVIEQRLRQLGFQPSTAPRFLVETRVTLRPWQVGAFVPAPEDGLDWVEMPQTKQQSSQRQVLALSVRIVDAGTLIPAYAATASLIRFKGSPGKAAPGLAAAALAPLH